MSNASILENRAAPAVTDFSMLFRYSGLLDALRDAVKILFRTGTVSPSAIVDAANQYNQLRQAVMLAVDPIGAAEIEMWSPYLEPDTVSIDSVYLATVAITRLVDLIHQTPDWLLSQRVREVNAQQVHDQIEKSKPREPGTPSVLHWGMLGP